MLIFSLMFSPCAFSMLLRCRDAFDFLLLIRRFAWCCRLRWLFSILRLLIISIIFFAIFDCSMLMPPLRRHVFDWFRHWWYFAADAAAIYFCLLLLLLPFHAIISAMPLLLFAAMALINIICWYILFSPCHAITLIRCCYASRLRYYYYFAASSMMLPIFSPWCHYYAAIFLRAISCGAYCRRLSIFRRFHAVDYFASFSPLLPFAIADADVKDAAAPLHIDYYARHTFRHYLLMLMLSEFIFSFITLSPALPLFFANISSCHIIAMFSLPFSLCRFFISIIIYFFADYFLCYYFHISSPFIITPLRWLLIDISRAFISSPFMPLWWYAFFFHLLFFIIRWYFHIYSSPLFFAPFLLLSCQSAPLLIFDADYADAMPNIEIFVFRCSFRWCLSFWCFDGWLLITIISFSFSSLAAAFSFFFAASMPAAFRFLFRWLFADIFFLRFLRAITPLLHFRCCFIISLRHAILMMLIIADDAFAFADADYWCFRFRDYYFLFAPCWCERRHYFTLLMLSFSFMLLMAADDIFSSSMPSSFLPHHRGACLCWRLLLMLRLLRFGFAISSILRRDAAISFRCFATRQFRLPRHYFFISFFCHFPFAMLMIISSFSPDYFYYFARHLRHALFFIFIADIKLAMLLPMAMLLRCWCRLSLFRCRLRRRDDKIFLRRCCCWCFHIMLMPWCCCLFLRRHFRCFATPWCCCHERCWYFASISIYAVSPLMFLRCFRYWLICRVDFRYVSSFHMRVLFSLISRYYFLLLLRYDADFAIAMLWCFRHTPCWLLILPLAWLSFRWLLRFRCFLLDYFFLYCFRHFLPSSFGCCWCRWFSTLSSICWCWCCDITPSFFVAIDAMIISLIFAVDGLLPMLLIMLMMPPLFAFLRHCLRVSFHWWWFSIAAAFAVFAPLIFSADYADDWCCWCHAMRLSALIAMRYATPCYFHTLLITRRYVAMPAFTLFDDGALLRVADIAVSDDYFHMPCYAITSIFDVIFCHADIIFFFAMPLPPSIFWFILRACCQRHWYFWCRHDGDVIAATFFFFCWLLIFFHAAAAYAMLICCLPCRFI